jgi:hypothetical protein
MNRNKVKMIRPLERVFEIISDDKLIETLSKLQFTSDDPTFDSKVFIQALHNITAVQVTKPTSNRDISQSSLLREDRKMWSPVQLIGRVYVRDNGYCRLGEKCDCENGIAVPGDRWIVMSRTSSQVIQILLK